MVKNTPSLNALESTLNLYFGKKAPALPKEIKELLVKLAPYLAILGVIIAIPGLLLALGFGGIATMMAPFGGPKMIGYVPGMWLSLLLSVPLVILEIMAIPGLFKRKMIAWKYLCWAELIAVAASVIQLNIVGAIIGALIGFYLLFQVRSLYK